VPTPKSLRGTFVDNAPELDHIIPLSLGGTHTKSNTQLLCRKCNRIKGATSSGQLRMPFHGELKHKNKKYSDINRKYKRKRIVGATATCKHCGKEFTISLQSGRIPVYCSKKCGDAYTYLLKRKLIQLGDRECKHCGITFQPNRAHQKFCSPTCRKEYYKVGPTQEIKCEYCGATFLPKSSTQKFCSEKCRRTSESQREYSKMILTKTCEYCGDIFITTHKEQRFCSKTCSGKYIRSKTLRKILQQQV
jgi:endogenous inhibitor of DNA gyrase (YacG/DUF329 family)